MATVAVVYHSGYGHTAALANEVAAGGVDDPVQIGAADFSARLTERSVPAVHRRQPVFLAPPFEGEPTRPKSAHDHLMEQSSRLEFDRFP